METAQMIVSISLLIITSSVLVYWVWRVCRSVFYYRPQALVVAAAAEREENRALVCMAEQDFVGAWEHESTSLRLRIRQRRLTIKAMMM
jgi:hypothetical protein